jgi:hypothetical protein
MWARPSSPTDQNKVVTVLYVGAAEYAQRGQTAGMKRPPRHAPCGRTQRCCRARGSFGGAERNAVRRVMGC